MAKFLLSRAVRDAGYKVVITGEGSDEILGGYAHFRRDMLLYNRDGQDPAEVAALLEDLERLNPGVARIAAAARRSRAARKRQAAARLCSFLDRNLLGARRRRCRPCWPEISSQTFGQREGYHALLERHRRSRPARRAAIRVHQSLYLWAKTLLPNYILTMLGDRMEMAHSIEGRVPFLDHHVVEVIRSQPVTQKIRGMTEKYVLREAVRDVITDTVYRRQKHPFLSPPATLNPEREAQHAGAGHAARPGAGFHPILRSEEDRRPAGQPATPWMKARASPTIRC